MFEQEPLHIKEAMLPFHQIFEEHPHLVLSLMFVILQKHETFSDICYENSIYWDRKASKTGDGRIIVVSVKLRF